MNSALKYLFEVFRTHHKQLYIVGGAVRDGLIGENPDDFDLTTNALPIEMECWFDHVVTIGKRFGTVGVALEDKIYEITTFRREADYSDGRHPEKIIFTDDVREDVARRDFTINGLLMDERGCILDYVGGLRDIKAGLIRCIGNPDWRFEEDKLRKWRCVRLATEKKMEIEKVTRNALEADTSINGVSMERIWSELTRIIRSKKVTWGGYLLVKTGLYSELLRKIIPDYGERNEEHLVENFEIMAYLPQNLALRLAALILFMHEEERRCFLETLHCPNKEAAMAMKYCRYFRLNTKDILQFKVALADFGPAQAEDLWDFQQGLSEWENNKKHLIEIEENRRVFHRIMKNKEPLMLADLSVNGEDIENLGYKDRKIGVILKQLLERVYVYPEDNTKDKLLAYLERDNNGKTDIPKSD